MSRKIEVPINGNLLEAFADVILENKTMTLSYKDDKGEWVEVEIMSIDEYAQRKK